MKTLEELDIFSQEKFKQITGAELSGGFKALSDIFITACDDSNFEIDKVIDEAFLTTCSMEALVKHTGGIIQANIGAKAKGYVYFYGNLGTKVAKGVSLSDDNNSYVTLDAGEVKEFTLTTKVTVVDGVVTLNLNSTIPSSKAIVKTATVDLKQEDGKVFFELDGIADGEEITLTIFRTDPVSIECTEDGEEGNRKFDHNLVLDAVSEVDSVCKVLNLYGGKDDETEAEFRARAIEFKRSAQGPFNTESIIKYIKDRAPFLKGVWVKKKDDLVQFFCLNHQLGLLAEEQAHILSLLHYKKPVNLDKEDIKVLKPNVKKVLVKIKGLRPNAQDLQEIIKENLIYYFEKEMLFEKEITKFTLDRIINQSRRGIDNVEEYSLQEGTVSATDDTVVLLSDVQFEE